jgi:hypothetical protein
MSQSRDYSGPTNPEDRAVQLKPFAILLALLPLLAAGAALGQSLRIPERGESGLDPAFARGLLAPDQDRYGYGQFHWRDSIGFSASQRMQWAYALGQRTSLGMSLASGRDFDSAAAGLESRQYGLFGRYWFGTDWSFSAEAVSREPGSVLRFQDFRIGVQRQF